MKKLVGDDQIYHPHFKKQKGRSKRNRMRKARGTQQKKSRRTNRRKDR